jgi:hypothetical protein
MRTPEGESWSPDIAQTLAVLLPAEAPSALALARSPQEVVADAIRDGIDPELWEGACH